MDELLTPQEAADFLKVSKQWVYQKKAEGVLPFRKIGGSLRFVKAELIEWVKNQ